MAPSPLVPAPGPGLASVWFKASCDVGPSQEQKHTDTVRVPCSEGASLSPRGLPVIQPCRTAWLESIALIRASGQVG